MGKIARDNLDGQSPGPGHSGLRIANQGPDSIATGTQRFHHMAAYTASGSGDQDGSGWHGLSSPTVKGIQSESRHAANPGKAGWGRFGQQSYPETHTACSQEPVLVQGPDNRAANPRLSGCPYNWNRARSGGTPWDFYD